MGKVGTSPVDEQYATSVEVDGIRRTLTDFMKTQEASNEAMKKGLDDVLTTLAKLGGSLVEDKGSSFKGKNPKPPNPEHSTHAYVPPIEDITRANHDTVFVEYDLSDCPWTADELEQFYEFATVPPYEPPHTVKHQPLYQHHNRQDYHQVHTHVPDTVFVQPPPLFHKHMQFQHKAVAKGPKLNFPEFDGSDPDGWIRKAEEYFELVGVPNEDRVKIAVLYISGKAEYWWRGTGCNANILPWHQFCRLVGDRFNETSSYEAIGQFHNLKQTGTVSEYVDKFEEFMGLVKRNNPSLPEDYFISSFVSGLKEHIQHHLQCHKPTTLTNAYWYAKRLEQTQPVVKKFPFANSTMKTPKPWVKDKEVKDQANPTIADLRAAGKCFKCREPWVPGHTKVCKGKQNFSVILIQDEAGQENAHLVNDQEDRV